MTFIDQIEPNDNAPWMSPGWFDEAATWMTAQLSARGLSIDSEVRQVRSWFLSSILAAIAGGEEFYLKAAPPIYSQEPTLTLDLSKRFRGFVPDVVATDAERGWTLMRAVPGVRLDRHPDTEKYIPRWERLLLRFAEIQLSYMGRVDELLAMGCFDFRLPRLYQHVEALFAELPTLLEGSNDLSEGQISQLQASLPRLRAIFDALEGSGIPPTLHHGDFHSGNILCDTDCVLLDWSGFIGVAHPFLFLSVVSEEHTQEAVLSGLIDVYLSAWSAYGSPDELRKLARLGIVAGWLAGAVGHRRQIAIAAGPSDEEQERGNLVYCLNALLRLLDNAQRG